jgi:geranylgeranyl diphosphate synthase type II
MTSSLKTIPPKTPKLDRLTRLIDQALQRLIPAASAAPRGMSEGIRYCLFSKGKRFRPLLTLGACEAVGSPARRALSVACAIELIHTYSLVHDDLPAMDNADERRGQPSCHRKFGEANAILVGDALLTLAFELLSHNGTPRTMRIIQTIGKASGTHGLIGGQVLDLQAAWGGQRPTERLLASIAQRKTAALIAASVVAGGLAGGGTPGAVKRLERYGQDIGFAFQLRDDVHDGDGLVRALGLEAVRQQAQQLSARAVRALEAFGKRAAVLRELATWLATTS